MKIASSGDWHLGSKNGNEEHCKDVVDFVQFLKEECKKRGVLQFVHTGDFFDRRDKIDTLSLNYGLAIVNELNEAFSSVVMLKGNHDIMRKDSRMPSSLQIFENKVNLVDNVLTDGDVMYVSWLCSGEEFDEMVKLSKKRKIKYAFGHFEFSNFKMNANYVMEHGQTHKSLKHVKRVISGHYHSRQEKDNVLYNGAPFPLNYSNANENNLGFSILDTETGEIEFVEYHGINILSMTAKELLESNLSDFTPKTSVRVIVDDTVDDDEYEKLQEKLLNTPLRDTKIVYDIKRNQELLQNETEVAEITSIDNVVLNHLKDMKEVDGLNKDILIEIYKQAMENSND